MPGAWTEWLTHSTSRNYRRWVENGQTRLFQWDDDTGPYTDSSNRNVPRSEALTITSTTPRYVPDGAIRRTTEAPREIDTRRGNDNRTRQIDYTQARQDGYNQPRRDTDGRYRPDTDLRARELAYAQARQRSDSKALQDSDGEGDGDGEARKDRNPQARRETDPQPLRDTNVRFRRDTDSKAREALDLRERGNVDSRTLQTTYASSRPETNPRTSSERIPTGAIDRRYSTASDSRSRGYETVTGRLPTTDTTANVSSRQPGMVQTSGVRGNQAIDVTQNINYPRINNANPIFPRQQPSDGRSTGTQQQATPGARPAPINTPRQPIGGQQSAPNAEPGSPPFSLSEAETSRALQNAASISAVTRGLRPTGKLDAAYRLHHTRDFKRGWVFQVLWHENHGRHNRTNEPNMPTTPTALNGLKITDVSAGQAYGEPIHTSVRRMVVIQQKAAFSICVPINTYGGRGCMKPGLTPAEVGHHAVVHESGRPAAVGEDERRRGLIKAPIAVRMNKGEALNKWSRVRFDKPCVVEHDYRVKSIGNVVPKDIHLLVKYFREGTAIND